MTKRPHASHSEKKKEDWMNSKWRPMMGWMYMAVCTCDFMLFPILWSLLQSLSHGTVQTQWQPLTLQGAGLFHVAMGAVLGIAAYGRTQEKLGGANNGGIQLPTNAGTTYVPPGSTPQPVSNPLGSPPMMNTGFGSNTGFVSQPQPFVNAGYNTAPVTTGWGGKKAPPQPDFPEI
jgi:Holin of 3TMs, for gene-transfer release